MKYPQRFLRLVFGLFLCAFSMVFGIYSTLGLTPWNVLAEGVSLLSGITMGQASQIIGFFLLFLDFALKEPIGIGSIANMLLVGFFLDKIMLFGLIPIPDPEQLLLRFVYLVLNMVIYGIGIFFYMGAGFGSGPRDGLMVALSKRFRKLPVGIVKGGNDVVVTVAGWLLGGLVGIGTLINALCTGYVLQFVFHCFHFDVKAVQHEYAFTTAKNLLHIFKKKEVPVE